MTPWPHTNTLSLSLSFLMCLSRDLKKHMGGSPLKKAIMTFVMTKLVDARTEGAYDAAWREFQNSWPSHVKYMTYWHEKRTRWAKPFRNRVFNLGFKASSCAEAMNRSMKAGMKRKADLKVPLLHGVCLRLS